jgi:hypothetical protein
MNFSDTTEMYASYNFERLKRVPNPSTEVELDIESKSKDEINYVWSINIDRNDTVDILGHTAYKLTMSTTHSVKPIIEVERVVYLAKDLFFDLPENSKYDNLILSHFYEDKIPLKIVESTYFSEGAKSSLEMKAMVIFDKKLPKEIFYPLGTIKN